MVDLVLKPMAPPANSSKVINMDIEEDILAYDSDDSVKDPLWQAISEEDNVVVPSSESEDDVQSTINDLSDTVVETHVTPEVIRPATYSSLCALVSQEEREKLHSQFWNLKTWPEKKAFVKNACVRREIRRRRKDQVSLKKRSGHDIFFNKSDGQYTKVRVCRLFFLNTLCLGEDSFRRWTKEVECVEDPHKENSPARSTEDPLETPGRVQVKYTKMTKSVKTWIDLIPKVPSHYCRASSQKLYVEPTFRSEKHMHEVYVEWCDEQDLRAASRPTFLKVLKQENIAIHHPRKDQCDTCCSFKVGNISQEEYDNHMEKKMKLGKPKKMLFLSPAKILSL